MSDDTDVTPEQHIRNVAKELGLEMVATFVPFSQSRNKAEKHPSLNWRVSLLRNGNLFLQTDYSAGSAHAPSYDRSQASRLKRDDEVVRWECEHGFAGWRGPNTDTIMRRSNARPLTPNFAAVLYSLVNDADALEHPTFETWAETFGYEPDSRNAESIYRACLDIALKLRNAIGEAGLAKLREACQDY